MNRRDRAEYSRVLSTLKRWDVESRNEGWTAGEWSDLVSLAAAQKAEGRESVRISLLRPIVSAAAALAVLVWAALFFLKTRPADLSARNSARQAEIAAPLTGAEQPQLNASPTGPAARVESASSRPAAAEARNLLASAARAERSAGDKPAFTWISPDTGLQIVWFTNNNLNLEDRQ
jgi:hypothetical protein